MQLDDARQLAGWGFNVLPARGKAPAVTWQQYQDQRSDVQLANWFGNPDRPFNFWIACGRISGVAVLDIDNAAADEHWHNLIGEALEATACVRTAKGHHYYFALPEGREVHSWSQHTDGLSFDLRAEGTGVLAPPSVHPDTGAVYEWVRDPTQGLVALPEALFGPESGPDGRTGAIARSSLNELLSTPPRGEGGRNDWLAKVAGHYAKTYRHLEWDDAYLVHCQMANSLLDPELSEFEFLKTIKSIWKKEEAKPERQIRAVECTQENGWLVGTNVALLTIAKEKDGRSLAQWSDFDIDCIGVSRRGEETAYDCVLRTERGDDPVLLPGAVLGSAPKLAVWLTNHRVGILPPPNEVFGLGSRPDRLRVYLESQNPPQFDVVDYLGWHDGIGFVTHDGIITAEGLSPFDNHRPDPTLRERARYSYGFAPADDAVEVLREVLTFHDETVCSVFGAWWVAALLRGQLDARSSLFPFMALEAPSESGKTTGFFSLMLQLAGSKHGNMNPTRAALRDMVASHRSGIVWIDDLDDPAHLTELLRQATGRDAGMVKKGEDNTSQVEVRLVAPITISGEALNLHGQKALADRAVSLEVPSPIGRRSHNDPGLPQWDDVVALKNRHPDLSVFAGTLVQAVLVYAPDHLDEFNSLRVGGGRFGDKVAVLRVGARVLAAVTGDDFHVERVDAWCDNELVSVGNENALTLKLLPAALRQLGWPDQIMPAEGRWPHTCVTLDAQGAVWFSPIALAAWWSEMQHGRVELRTETEEALRQQAKALGLGGAKGVGRKNIKIRGTQDSVIMWRLDSELSGVVVGRSRGESPDGVIEGAQREANSALFGDWDPT